MISVSAPLFLSMRTRLAPGIFIVPWFVPLLGPRRNYPAFSPLHICLIYVSDQSSNRKQIRGRLRLQVRNFPCWYALREGARANPVQAIGCSPPSKKRLDMISIQFQYYAACSLEHLVSLDGTSYLGATHLNLQMAHNFGLDIWNAALFWGRLDSLQQICSRSIGPGM